MISILTTQFRFQILAGGCVIIALLAVSFWGYSTRAASTATIAATVSATSLAVSVSDGSIAFGSVPLNTATTTVGHGETQTVSNDGSDAVINVKSTDATGGTTWTLGSTPGSNIFKLEVSTTSGSTYQAFTAANTYLTASSSSASLTSGPFDFRLTTPTASTDFVQKSITITVQVTAP
jgi:hypothetical protein